MTTPDEAQALLPVTVTQADVELGEAIAQVYRDGKPFPTRRMLNVIARHRISHFLAGDVGMREALELARSIIGNMIRHGFAYIVEADEKMPIPQPNAFYIGPGVLPKIDAALTPSALSPEPVQNLHELKIALDGVDCITRRNDNDGGQIVLTWLEPKQSWPLFNLLSAVNSGLPSALSGDAGEGQSKRIYREFPVNRSQVENDEFMKGFPDWIKGRVAILGYREQGFRVCAQPGGKDVGNGEWGDLIVEYADGSLGVRAALPSPQGAE